MSKIFSSFRIRFLIILAVLLFGTLVVQYLLNLRAERNNALRIAEQAKALMSGIALGLKSINDKEYLYQLRKESSEPLPDLVQNILTIDEKLRVYDSLDTRYLPVQEGNTAKYLQLADIAPTLPPVIRALNIAGDNSQLPLTFSAATSLSTTEPRAFLIPIEGLTTSDNREVKWHLIVVVGPAEQSSGVFNRQAAKPLIYTLVILLIATSLAALLVWSFTKPIADLSFAARKIADGQLYFRVPTKKQDEMGQLVTQFNEMIAGLERGRELEAKLRDVEKSAVVGRLASGIAHEIRNPLNYINLTLDRLRTSYKPSDEMKQEKYDSHIANIKEELKRINKLVSDFLNFTRPPELEMKPLDLKEELEDSMRIVEAQASENNIQTVIHLNGDVPSIMGDQEALRSVFTNLFLNAVQAMGVKGGVLVVKVNTDAENVRIEISDTGCGIPPENLPKLFEPYFSTKETGTGLGLAIVKKNLEEHKGKIDVQSTPNEGTTITVTLPIKE
jgi:signal transduction histidine kinase